MKRHSSHLSQSNQRGYRAASPHWGHERSRDIDTEWASGHGLPFALVGVMVMVMTLMMPDDLPMGMETLRPIDSAGSSAARVNVEPISPISSALVDQI